MYETKIRYVWLGGFRGTAGRLGMLHTAQIRFSSPPRHVEGSRNYGGLRKPMLSHHLRQDLGVPWCEYQRVVQGNLLPSGRYKSATGCGGNRRVLDSPVHYQNELWNIPDRGWDAH